MGRRTHFGDEKVEFLDCRKSAFEMREVLTGDRERDFYALVKNTLDFERAE